MKYAFELDYLLFNIVDLFDNKSRLHKAASKGFLHLVKEEIMKSSDIDKKNEVGMTALHCASKNGHIDVIKHLLENNADTSIVQYERNIPCGINGFTAVHFAVKNMQLDAAQCLLDKGADINIQNYTGYSPLHIAADNKHYEMVDLLVKRKADINLQSFGAHSGKPCLSPLHKASHNGSIEIVEYLIKHGANVNIKSDRDYTPLHECNPNSTSLLINNGADINSQNSWGATPLWTAVNWSQQEKVSLLLKAGADVNLGNKDGETPLHVAKNIEIIELCLKAGANIEAKDNKERTPLLSNAINLRLEALKSLMANKANIEATDKHGATILHYLAQKDFPSYKEQDKYPELEILLKLGIDVQDDQGETPLHWAAYNGAIEYTKFLLGHSANARITDNNGNTPIDVAKSRGHNEIKKYLIDWLYN